MVKIIEKSIDTILRPTGISLAQYVINPYQGCAFACLFCYAQFSKAAQKEPLDWGQYVKVKINALEVLEEELKTNTPKQVLIGSTTEPFQEVEKQYGLTRGIIRMLNKKGIKYVLMSRALLLGEYIDELDKQLCEAVYFTVDIMPDMLKRKLQPHAAAQEESISLVNKLNDSGINAVAYFCPVMPFLYEHLQKVSQLKSGTRAEFEIVNFQMSGIKKIIKIIEPIFPEAADNYKKMRDDKAFYENVLENITGDIRKISAGRFKDMKIHGHKYEDYFKNSY